MLVTLFGMLILIKLLQSLNAELPILAPLVIMTIFNLELLISSIAIAGIVAVSIGHPSNTMFPILVTSSGITTFVKLLQSKNAESPILVTLCGMVTLFKPLQLSNAELPIFVRLSGMEILVKPLQPSNAESAIVSVPALMAYSPINEVLASIK